MDIMLKIQWQIKSKAESIVLQPKTDILIIKPITQLVQATQNFNKNLIIL